MHIYTQYIKYINSIESNLCLQKLDSIATAKCFIRTLLNNCASEDMKPKLHIIFSFAIPNSSDIQSL